MSLCTICKLNKAEFPDKKHKGWPTKRICKQCHELRLKKDIVKMLDSLTRDPNPGPRGM